MTKEQMLEYANEMPNETRDRIAACLDKASAEINAAECLMSGIGKCDLILDDAATLWCNLYDAKKIFAVNYGKTDLI